MDIRGSLTCGKDVFIDINAVFEGEVILGNGVSVGANCVLSDVNVADGSVIHAMSHVQGAVIGKDCSVGPYARLRPGTVLADGARIGNFAGDRDVLSAWFGAIWLGVKTESHCSISAGSPVAVAWSLVVTEMRK